MENIETFEVRLSPTLSAEFENNITEVIEQALSKEDVLAIQLYKKVHIKSDYLIVLICKKQFANKQTIDLGEQLKSALKEYGLIYHNYWNKVI